MIHGPQHPGVTGGRGRGLMGRHFIASRDRFTSFFFRKPVQSPPSLAEVPDSVLAFLYTGTLLFNTHDTNVHLAMMEKVRSSPMSICNRCRVVFIDYFIRVFLMIVFIGKGFPQTV